MNTTSESILEKIRKLLRLADTTRGATENEAKVALAKAQELMTRHNIDSVLLRMQSGETGFGIGKGNVDLPKTLNPADTFILTILQRFFNVKCVLGRNGSGTGVDIIGTAEDIEFAIHAFKFLRPTFFRCWNEYHKTVPFPSMKSYYHGLHDGICEALKEARKKAEQSYAATQRDAYALAVVDQKQAIARFVEANYSKLKSRKMRATRMNSSYYHGAEKGRTIQINKPLAN
jgi:hypothetical protein